MRYSVPSDVNQSVPTLAHSLLGVVVVMMMTMIVSLFRCLRSTGLQTSHCEWQTLWFVYSIPASRHFLEPAGGSHPRQGEMQVCVVWSLSQLSLSPSLKTMASRTLDSSWNEWKWEIIPGISFWPPFLFFFLNMFLFEKMSIGHRYSTYIIFFLFSFPPTRPHHAASAKKYIKIKTK